MVGAHDKNDIFELEGDEQLRCEARARGKSQRERSYGFLLTILSQNERTIEECPQASSCSI
eukprot:scaffold377919_cov55-Attheya_sp.AAC.4